jgi:hypothetical protein
MNRSIPSFLHLPVLLMVIGIVLPITWLVLGPPDSVDFTFLTWICNIWYIAISLIATEAVLGTLFVRPQAVAFTELKHLHLQFILRHLMLGLILWVCNWHILIDGLNEAAAYLTMRLGVTLFLLGILVVWVAHTRMKAL